MIKSVLSVFVVLFSILLYEAYSETVQMNSLRTTQGSKIIYSSSEKVTLGNAVEVLGDINGDGISDFMVAAPEDNSATGKVAIIYGVNTTNSNSDSTFPKINISSMGSSKGFYITGENAGDNFGYSIAALGDINGDKVPDFAIGAPGYNAAVGIVYVLYGNNKTTQDSFSISDMVIPTDGFKIINPL